MDNKKFVEALKRDKPREKTAMFGFLLSTVEDEDMADVIWILWGEDSIAALDDPAPALNRNSKWWKCFEKKNTIRSLLKTPEGRQHIWQMLHDASAWL